ncbi:Cna B-type domain-containing protein [Streptococcus gallolyticus]|uniref:Cna B-type domain-containing protein n=1 Tax=Streptococcus gallolyticus TaxID=315405 RepID=UPI002283FC76|nr:Cna B-type domain-containing protein [Streptococcus gallolyticus]MCY7173104.1 Cna B-type domain-containing protein [Streptococcus gallolyticus subsp. gallolyticus]MCY7175227.1 Cna B-type domain-containing protein [Streptococcus gallolyticus subsp. gallolyticus]
MKKLFTILFVLLSVLCFLGGEKGVLAESNSLETFRGYVNNDGKSSESRLGINNIYIDDNSQTIVGYCFNIKKQYPSMYGDRYTKYTNVTAEQMKENSSSTLEDAVLYDSVMKVLYNGYPNNGSSIQQKYQLTDDQFRGITQLVIWKFTDSYTGYSFSSDNLENAYNELSNVSQLTYPSNFKLNLYLSTNPYVQNLMAVEMLPENQTEYTSVSVNKVWDDANNQDGQRSSEVIVQLLANGVEVSGQQLVLSDANGWNGTFENLDKYDSDNVLIDYTVKEVTDLSGYQSVVSGSDNNYTITNTHVPEVINLSGTKTWDDNNNQDGIRPESIVVHLLANGVDTGQTKEVSQTDNWTYQFENLPKYQNGQEIVYTVSEDSVGGYETIISGFNITNSHTPETTEVSGTKTWNDNDDQDGKRPDSITVNLLANGTKVASQEVTADTNWTYTFSNLAKYANGSAITYTVTEDSVDNYTTTINGYDITNSYTPGKTSLTVTKIWDDSDDQDGLRPNSIDVQLYANGKKSGDVVTLTAADNWTYTWTNLAEKANKKDIVYSVKEVTEVDGYTTTEGKVENGNVTITNTHVPVIPEEPEDPKTTDVTFSKVEVNGSAELPGASLKVVSGETADGQIATDAKTGENLAWTSGDTAKVFSLSEGTYTMVESQAPAGYELAESITFRVTADGQVEVKGTDGSWTVQADATIKMEDAKTPVIPEKPQSNTPTVDDPTTPSSNSDKQSEKKQEKKSLLPSTGDSSGLGLMMIGPALVLSVIFGFVYKAKRAKA